MPVKTDRKDARGIAQLMWLGWYRRVHCKCGRHWPSSSAASMDRRPEGKAGRAGAVDLHEVGGIEEAEVTRPGGAPALLEFARHYNEAGWAPGMGTAPLLRCAPTTFTLTCPRSPSYPWPPEQATRISQPGCPISRPRFTGGWQRLTTAARQAADRGYELQLDWQFLMLAG